jgi:hypothetical protein
MAESVAGSCCAVAGAVALFNWLVIQHCIRYTTWQCGGTSSSMASCASKGRGCQGC